MRLRDLLHWETPVPTKPVLAPKARPLDAWLIKPVSLPKDPKPMQPIKS
ncbi:hypothetical protein [uncultured Thiothrix sp.]|nr:hypothetical protein [uncultured Thiothrix sp.]HMT94918.1 hypothetical protein [Thiolinea sp.]